MTYEYLGQIVDSKVIEVNLNSGLTISSAWLSEVGEIGDRVYKVREENRLVDNGKASYTIHPGCPACQINMLSVDNGLMCPECNMTTDVIDNHGEEE